MDDYSVPSFRIGPGKLVGTYNASGSLGKNVTDTKIQNLLQELVAAKTILNPAVISVAIMNHSFGMIITSTML
jgi:hypothetical protein